MTRPGRLPCVNPHCGRTAPADEFGDTDIVCSKCWKLLPQPVRARFRQLRRRERRLLQLIDRRLRSGAPISRGTASYLEGRITSAFAENWQLIRDYFRVSEKPLGLEGFLQEVGL
ncbi:MAG: hypothetical protein PS018_17200 [bacterium]|nr:hypothetical protein [bacterium]